LSDSGPIEIELADGLGMDDTTVAMVML
jgi:hypothetical protein